jgi:tRNA 2-thiouridine synthesizing protein A
MTASKTVDARGLSCPHPVMLARQAINEVKQGIIEVLVDSGTARDNVSRLGKNLGWTVTVEDKSGDSIKVVMKK